MIHILFEDYGWRSCGGRRKIHIAAINCCFFHRKTKTIPSKNTTALEKNKGTLTKSEDTIEFDMKGTRRNRDNQLEKIMGELCLETESTDTTDEDDLLALMDRAQ